MGALEKIRLGLARAGESTLVQVLLLLALTKAMRDHVWLRLPDLPPAIYESFSWLSSSLLERRSALTLLFVLVLAVWFRRDRWKDLGPDGMRWLWLPMVWALAWYVGALDYNLVVDKLHPIDRLVIIALAVAAFRRPALVPLCFAVCLVGLGQERTLILSLGLPDKRLLWDSLAVFVSWRAMAMFLPVRWQSATWALLVVVGASYLGPAVNKIQIATPWTSWLLDNDMAALIVASEANGWWWFAEPETVWKIARFFSTLHVPLALGTMVVESAGLLLATRRRLALLALAGFLTFHSTVLVLTGICFWKWIVVDTAVFVFLWRPAGRELFEEAWPVRVVFVVLVALSPWWLNPKTFAWFDAPWSEQIHHTVVVEDGREIPWARPDFAPFEMRFAQSRLYYLWDKGRCVGTYAGTTQRGFDRFDGARSLKDAKKRAKRCRKRRIHRRKLRDYDRFIRRFFKGLNRHGDFPLSWFPMPPTHIWSNVRGDGYQGEKVVAVRAYLERRFWDGEVHHVVDRRKVREIRIEKTPKPKKKP